MLGTMLAVDDMVASLVSALKRNGEYDSTTLVFVSDNGFNFGAHRLNHKMAPYEESIRVPFVMAGPGIPKRAEPAMVAQVDLAPTLLDFAGAPVPATVDGRSLRPLLTGGSQQWRSDLLVEFSGLYHPFFQLDTLAQVRSAIAAGLEMFVPTYRGVRTGRYLYVEWYGGAEHEYELYDLETDPWQMSNLLAPPGGAQQHAALTAQLQARLTALASCRGSSCR
jgi:arylsulfatase A-like enzyme